MNYSKIASDFLKWAAAQNSDKALAELLRFYLDAKHYRYEERDFNKIIYIVRMTIKMLGE